jgi:hypothetical protein
MLQGTKAERLRDALESWIEIQKVLIASLDPDKDNYERGVLSLQLKIAEDAKAKATAEAANADLAPSGKDKAAMKAAHEAIQGEAENWKQFGARDEARYQAMEPTVLGRATVTRPPDPDPAERLAYAMRQAEFRASIPKDPLVAEAIYRAGQGDPFIVDAFESAPPVLRIPHPGAVPRLEPLVAREVVAEATAARARASADPAAVEALEQLDRRRILLANRHAAFRAAVLEAVPEADGDPIAQLATGKAHA